MKKLSILDQIQITIEKRLKIYDMLDGFMSSGISIREALERMREIENFSTFTALMRKSYSCQNGLTTYCEPSCVRSC